MARKTKYMYVTSRTVNQPATVQNIIVNSHDIGGVSEFIYRDSQL